MRWFSDRHIRREQHIIFSCFRGLLVDWMFGSWFVFVREKAKELWEWLHNLEAIKYDHGEALKRQRYEVSEETWYICACCKTFNLLFGLSVFIWSSVWIISLYSNTTYLNVQNVSLVFCGIFISTANTTVEFKKTCFCRMCEYFTMTFISCDTYSLMSVLMFLTYTCFFGQIIQDRRFAPEIL